MSKNLQKVKNYLLELGYPVVEENPEEEILVVSFEEMGLKNLVLDCEELILVIEQFILKIKTEKIETYKSLLQINRELVHGAFVLDQSNNLVFRDTLRIQSLDLEELRASIYSLSVAIVEYSKQLIKFSE